MPSSDIYHRVAIFTTDVSEELIASIIKVERISELETALAVTSNEVGIAQLSFDLIN
jgi:hypothetical protein